MSRLKPLPVNEFIARFMNNEFSERAELVRAVRQELLSSKASKLFTAEVGTELAKQNAHPIDGLGTMLVYGMVIGILMERHGSKRLII